ncbi:DUF1178 family protein [uncultured Tateyamaria sp.]|uniref:DUF1178 family protein n=1 Tax=uncultured Tateyamaria sp. TaxID=455651 RepID=UPI002605263D|nr:DUF1178 family protein [uncultured Tateyamaria sp.]
MIKYTLKCDSGHQFDSWFANAGAYDSLRAAGHVSCASCGSNQIDKAVMAPRVATSRMAPVVPAEDASADVPPEGAAADPAEVEAALRKMRAEVEKNATYVGGNFAREARDMHLGDAPDRPIWGEANAREAKALIEDGVPVAPLPFIPTRKAN